MGGWTNGPWQDDGVVVWAPGDIPVCVMTSRKENELVHAAPSAPVSGLANARLIAAAPEMAEALEHAEFCIEAFAARLNHAEGEVAALRKVRAVLAKVRG